MWNKTLKDGVVGFVNKIYLSRHVIRWKMDQVFRGGGNGAPEPNWQHPPVVSLFFLVLAALWIGFFRYFRVLERRAAGGGG